MKVPISWLEEYVDFDAAPEEVARRLTFSGMELESLRRVGGDYSGMVVGEIRSIDRHPNADRLRLCRVFDGASEIPVVCGADNFEVGDRAALATVGAELPGGMKIRETKIRGEVSRGMLCAEDELGLSDDHAGILVLPRSLSAGTPLQEVLGPPDVVLDMEITWNRADCLSIVGIAREVAALFGTELRRPEANLSEAGEPVERRVTVTVEDAAGCPRYTARVLDGVVIGPSPMWMQQRLRMCGVRPINNVVDITNYVLLECGHPLHAFDMRMVDGAAIVVRRARPNETMETLDGVERTLDPDLLVIADARQPVAIAGVMGGSGSEIREDTGTVLLESACFHAPDIRRASSRLGLMTESSHRFERGVDINGVEWASRRAAALMAECAGATIAPGVLDVCAGIPEPLGIRVRFEKVRRTLGLDICDKEMMRIFRSLQLTVESAGDGACAVHVPTFRADLEIEADLIEEVARMHGLQGVPVHPPRAVAVPGAHDRPAQAIEKCRDRLVGLGLSEVVHYSFLSGKLLDQLGTPPERRVVLPNPVSVDHGVLRDSLLPQMIQVLGRNHAHQAQDAALFEIGRVFWKEGDQVREEDRVAFGLMGKPGRSAVDKRRPVAEEESFLWLKGILEGLMAGMRVGRVDCVRADHPCFEPGHAVDIRIEGTTVGLAGLVGSGIRHQWRITDPLAVAELSFAPLTAHLFEVPKARALSPYPPVRRDVAMIVGSDVEHRDVLDVIYRAAGSELTATELFDIFSGEGIGAGKRSLAYSMTFQSSERTLTDEDANGYLQKVRDALESELNVEIRDN